MQTKFIPITEIWQVNSFLVHIKIIHISERQLKWMVGCQHNGCIAARMDVQVAQEALQIQA